MARSGGGASGRDGKRRAVAAIGNPPASKLVHRTLRFSSLRDRRSGVSGGVAGGGGGGRCAVVRRTVRKYDFF